MRALCGATKHLEVLPVRRRQSEGGVLRRTLATQEVAGAGSLHRLFESPMYRATLQDMHSVSKHAQKTQEMSRSDIRLASQVAAEYSGGTTHLVMRRVQAERLSELACLPQREKEEKRTIF